MQVIEEENIYLIKEKNVEDHRMMMFVITVREKVIGQINVKMPKRKEEDQEVDLTEEVDLIEEEGGLQVVLEEIEKEEGDLQVVAKEAHLVVNLEVNLVKAIQSINIIYF